MELWERLLPEEFRNAAVVPVTFEHHRDEGTNSVKIVGYDAEGGRCFSCHSFVLSEEGFDVDEFPLLIDVYYERVAAWRLQYGAWVRSKSYCDRLDRCNPRLTTLPPELAPSVWEHGRASWLRQE